MSHKPCFIKPVRLYINMYYANFHCIFNQAMESTSLLSPSSLCFNPFRTSSRTRLRNHHPRKPMSSKTLAMRSSETHDQNCSGGWLVDVNMIVLRKRMHEMKMIERNYEPPAEWMEWEKRYYTSYDSIICDVVGVLQSLLLNTRPSVALGMLGLIVLSVPTAAAVMIFHFMQITLDFVSEIHLI